MMKVYLRVLFLLLISANSFAQVTYTWQGGSAGDYQVATNWTPTRTTPAVTDILAFDLTNAVEVANVPSQSIGAIRITAGTSSVTFKTNVSTNSLTLTAATPIVFNTAGTVLAGDLLTLSISAASNLTLTAGKLGIAPSTGGKLSISGTVNIAGGILDIDVAGSGGTTVNGTGVINYQSGTFSCLNASVLTFNNASNYNHASDGSFATNIPAATWATGANCNITGMNAGTNVPGGLSGVFFGNFRWNCASQTASVNLNIGAAGMNINGSFTLINSNGFNVAISGAASATISAASYSQTGGILVFQTGSGTSTLSIGGTFSHTGGTIDFINGSGSGQAILELRGALTKGASSTWSMSTSSSSAQTTIQFSGSAAQTAAVAGTWNAPVAGRSHITNVNTDIAGVTISSGNLRVYNAGSSAAALCTVTGIFAGNSIIYSGAGSGGTTLLYAGIQLQTATATEFPNSSGPFNLSINNSLGVNFPGTFSRTVSGMLSLLNGNLSIGSGNTLTLSNTNINQQLTHASGFITSGSLSRYFPTSGLPIDASTSASKFPFGAGVNDRSIQLYFSGSSLVGGTAGNITVTYNTVIGVTAISVTDGIALDKRSNTNWAFSTGSFALGSGGHTISITAQGNNIGAINDISTLRLTNGTAAFGTVIAATGTTDAPLIGKSALTIADINSKTYYYGSNSLNALQIITYTWVGGVSTDWTNPSNWTGGSGYPSSSSEIAIISSTSNFQPTVNTGVSINVYQLTVSAPMNLTLAGTGSINVADVVTFTGTASLSATSTFTYSSTSTSQNIAGLVYGNLTLTGSGAKVFPAAITVNGNYSWAGATPNVTTNSNTFTYAGTGGQRVVAGNYYNLTLTGNRGGAQIRLGTITVANEIQIANIFNVSGLSNYTIDVNNSTVRFTSASVQTIPGFRYNIINQANSGGRILDPLGSTSEDHVISCLILSRSNGGTFTVTNSKLRYIVSGLNNTSYSSPSYDFHDLEITGNLNGFNLDFVSNAIFNIAGTFNVSVTNYALTNTAYTINFNGTGNQTIPAYKSDVATNTPAYKFWNVTVAGGNRNVTLTSSSTDTIAIRGALTVSSSFTAGKGFVTSGSTVAFSSSSSTIPSLTPASGTNNYNNLVINGGTRLLAGNLQIGGDLVVNGSDATPATLTIGNGSSARTLTILGNLTIQGTTSLSQVTSQVDMNTGSGSTNVLLSGNLNITGAGQILTGVGSSNGNLQFNGATPTYLHSSIIKNGAVNFTVGNGTSATTLTLQSNMELYRSSTAPISSTLTVANNASLDAGIFNIKIGAGTTGAATFTLSNGAHLITANTGGIEGTASSSSTGTLINDATITKSYHVGSSYTFNGATTTPFPAAIGTLNNLNLGANVTLNKAIIATGTLSLAGNVLTQNNNDLQFSGLSSTTGSIAADKNSSITISGSVGTVGTLRFASGFATTGLLTINRPVTVVLGSNLLIDNTPLSGGYISGNAATILDINGNSLTINGPISGPGTFSGSATSNLTLGGAGIVGTISFTAGAGILKNFTLNNSAKVTLGNALEITAGSSVGNEGTLTVNGTARLTTGGFLTIKSNQFGTARIAQGDAGGNYISGNVTVERYIASSAKRAWRMLGANTYGQTIKQAWQENQPAGVNGNPGFGTIITGSSASWAANGFDYPSPGNSLLTYNPAINNWSTVASTNTAWGVAGSNKAYMLFVRGDRTATPFNGPASTATTLRSTGAVFQGNQPAVSVPTAGQFAIIGNCFASAIDFTATTDANIDDQFMVWDPKLAGAFGLGGYQTFSASNGWKPIPGGGSYPAGIANTSIQSGQAFAVYTSVGGGNITIRENAKVTGSQMVFRPDIQSATLRTSLYAINGATSEIADGNVAVFHQQFSNAVDRKDAAKLGNSGENFGLLREGKTLALEARKPIENNDTLFFDMRKLKAGQQYQLELTGELFSGITEAYLEDLYLNLITPIQLNGTTTVRFTINAEAASYRTDRFRVVFKSQQTLPVQFTTIAATRVGANVQTNWTVASEWNTQHYIVERSSDGRNFNAVATVAAIGNNRSSLLQYNWVDTNPGDGTLFYRIRAVSMDAAIQYSAIVKVALQTSMGGYTVYPNPVTDNIIGLQLKQLGKGTYQTRLLNQNGQVLHQQLIQYNGGTVANSIAPNTQLAAGQYQLQIISPDKTVTLLPVMVQ